MVLFFAGMAVGLFVALAAIALVNAGDEIDDREDKCRGCPYEDYSGGLRDCSICHDAQDGGRR